MKTLTLSFLTIVISLLTIAVNGAPGDLDPTFGTFGRVTTNISGTSSGATDVVVQPDGKIIAAGVRGSSGAETPGVLVRYTADGRIDATFGGSGIVVVNVRGASEHLLTRVALQPDGKILAVGSYLGDSDAGLYVVRFNENGTVDSAFGGSNNGYVLLSILNGGGLGQDIVLQSDGKIVVAGARVNLFNQTTDFAVYRFNADGSRDASFGSGGAAALTLAGNEVPLSAVIQSDGKIVVAGARNVSEDGTTGDIALARFNRNGSLDTGFGTGGTGGNALSSFADAITEIRLQADGKIVAAAVRCADANCTNRDGALLRYNPNGSLDTAFNQSGSVAVQVPGSTSTVAAALVIQSDGKIVVAGESFSPVTQSDAFVGRYNPDGSLDSTFGANGIVIADVDNSQQAALAVALQPDGKIVAAGSSLVGTRTDLTVWRFLGDTGRAATPRTLFDYDGDGKADLSVFRPSNGTWYSVGSSTGFTVTQFGIATDIPVAGDYDGDGKSDIAVFRPSNGKWYLLTSAGYTVTQFGADGDVPAPADYDGDGKTDIAVFRPSNGTWYLLSSLRNDYTVIGFGAAGDIPVAADYNGDGKSDIAVFRPSNGTWYLLTSAGYTVTSFGASGDIPVSGDYNGDGKSDIAVFRPSNNTWYFLTSAGFSLTTFGAAGDVPVAADYDGDGRTDIAVFRPSNGNWYLLTSAGFTVINFGVSGDIPVASRR